MRSETKISKQKAKPLPIHGLSASYSNSTKTKCMYCAEVGTLCLQGGNCQYRASLLLIEMTMWEIAS